MDKYNKRMSTYKHGEVQQKSVNLQTCISTTNECQPKNMENYNKRVSTYKHGEVQQTSVNQQTWRSTTK